ncbi:RHS repeat-associated core domain-containing protein [Mesoterricola silvestris]|uniref:PKD domain-containing protein n=1 Tax=Mesoterricola silvestris TaxID=2927979 RepID=A0AA48GT82_9BACT|nr:RHS repeat-associated core domain-containing protein [Mesoterricola silvestris]BDU73592.1 hypothetical protein METEAL_27660 [Mesoterricola silvestris]
MMASSIRLLALSLLLVLPLAGQNVVITGPGTTVSSSGNAVAFTGSDSGTGAANPVWTFGDGASASGWNVTHAYAAPGVYSVTLSASVPSEGKCLRWGTDADGNRVCLSYQTLWTAESANRSQTVLALPAITSLSCSPVSIYLGQATTLSWATTGASALELYGPGASVRSVTGTSSRQESPGGTSTYTLVAYNGAGAQSQASVSVAVLPAPALTGFTASPAAITSGDSTTLSWTAQGQTGLSLSGIGTVTGNSLVVSPPATTPYTLTASNPAGSDSRSLTVTVHPQPRILGFAAESNPVGQGQVAYFTPVFSGGTGVISGLGAVSSGQRIGVTVNAETRYVLTVSNPLNRQVTAELIVGVVAPPTIGSFTANPAAITAGDSTTLSWATQGQTALDLTPVGDVSGTSSRTVAPASTTHYTLTASNLAGPVSASLDVTVHPQPVISAFTAGRGLITQGQATTLVPVFAGGTGTLSGVGPVTSGQSVSVSPGSRTVYTLTVTNPLGRTASSALTVDVAGPPVISSFVPSKAITTAGKAVTLTLEFTGVKATIDGLPGSWSASPASTTVVVSQTTSFTLRVENAAGDAVTRTVQVEAVPGPAIASFVATGSVITQGDPLTLTGVFTGGTGIVTPQPGAVSSGQSVNVSPAATTTYTLTVTNAASDTTTATVTIAVEALPVIQGFTSDVARIEPGGSTYLTAQFTGGTAEIAPGLGAVLPGQPRLVQPAADTTYTLTVRNAAGREVTQSLLLRVGMKLKWVRSVVYLGDKEIAEVDQAGTHVTQVDSLGSPRFVTNGNGVLESMQKFTPFGELLAGDPSRLAKGFTGHEQTDPSGLIYMQARFYLPMYGRFASPDPARDQHFEETQSWNIYSYVQNNPVMMTDPTGESAWDVIKGAAYAIADNASLGAVGGMAEKYFGFNPSGQNRDFYMGAAVGSLASGEMGATTAAGGAAGGLATSPTGAGAVVGAAIAVYGGAVAVKSAGAVVTNLAMAAKADSPYSGVQDPKAVGEGRDFTRRQKAEAKAQNASRNGGQLKSDGDGKPLTPSQQSKKGVAPNPREAHVDHAKSKANGGSNSSSNMRVISREENLRKGRRNEP